MALWDPLLLILAPFSLCTSVLLLLLVLLVFWSLGRTSKRSLREPPGPWPLPLVGNLLQLDLNSRWETLLELSKKYGSVFTIHLGPKKVVVLAGYQTVREALVTWAEEFGEREQIRIMTEFNQGHGIIWSNGESWREMRRFALTNLKDFGMGRKACEEKICVEASHLIQAMKDHRGEAFDPTLLASCAISNIICSMVYGRRFDYGHQEFSHLVDRTRKRTELMFSPSVQMYNDFPWLFKWIKNRKEFQQLSSMSKKHNWEMCTSLKESLDPQKSTCVVDAFLVHQQNLENSGISNSHYHDENLLHTIMNLFAAGSETTSITMRWGLLFMAKYPEIQARVQEELSRVVGSRQVQLEDRKDLHLTNAVVHETQRLANISPTSLPHRTSQDVTFQGHFIPKGTTVIPLLASVLLDEKEWKEPHNFNPAHFLDEEGKFIKRDAFLPFSAGRRACPGESLARMELFLFLSNLLQQFCFCPPKGVPVQQLSLSRKHNPLKQKLRAVLRS